MKSHRTILLPWRRSLRARLTLLFVALGLVPAVVVGYSVLSNLTSSIDVWENPGVTKAMDSVQMLAKTSVNKLVTTLAAHARTVIQSPGFTDALAFGGGAAVEALNDLHTDSEVDLAALFTQQDGRWTEEIMISTDPLVLTDEDVELALHLTSYQTREEGYLVTAFPFEVDGDRHALVLGYKLGAEYIPHLESIAAALTYYSQLSLVKEATRHSALLTAGFVTLLALAVAIVAGRWVARGVSRPVENLVAGMQRLAKGERVQVQASGTDELRFLTDAFNLMARELEETRRELARTERLEAWQEMARRVAHEIRNPLTPIQFALHRLQRLTVGGKTPAPERIQDSVNAILEEVEGLKALAGTFSEFARLPDPEPVTLQVNDLVRSVAELIRAQGARLRLDLAPELPEIRVDRRGLRRVLTNLLKNAQESGADEMTVRSWVHNGLRSADSLGSDARLGPGSRRSILQERHVVVAVADTGPGIPAPALDRIFEPDYTTKREGSGLGLALVCRIIAQHSGALIVRPGTERGVEMQVHLPIQQPDQNP